MAFTSHTFQLLHDLKESGRYAFYKANESMFQIHLVEPFRDLILNKVRSRLSHKITEDMEIKKRLFGQVNKNDFGRGGAYPFYWGAFYPTRAARRQEDAQLLIFIESDYLEFGFFFGWDAQEQREQQLRDNSRLIQTSPTLFGNMIAFLESKAPSSNFVIRNVEYHAPDYSIANDDHFIDRKSPFSWKSFFQSLANSSLSQVDQFSPMIVLPKETVLRLTHEDLGARIADTFNGIFPMMLLAISSDPHKTIADYIAR